ncbi:O-antigen ligase [uncultured Clostridium sp.]|uniref:O-antigen ligase family protein n=1 Tax=uncultured Clostridium sp. TaxID=59620 RepID=UPI0025E9E3BE|nr:O-antigen ligase family protein [uncultured Clostridium sp.]
MKDKLKQIYDIIDNKFYFRLFYLFVSLSVVTVLKVIPGINLLSRIALIWGILLILFMAINDYKKRKIYGFDIPIGIFVIVTLLFNLFVYRGSENLKIWIFNLVLFISIFTVDVFRNKKVLIKEMNITTHFYAVFMFAASLISIIMKIFNKSFTVGEYIFEGSKGGIFENPNAISIAAAIAIVMSIYIHHMTKNFRLKIFWCINIAIQGITMILFNGRSSYLVVIAVVYCFAFIYSNNKYIRAVLLIIPIIACTAAINIEGNHIRDFTSGRTSLWESASIVIKDNPVTGVGYNEMVDAVTNARETEDLPGLSTGRLHNIYVEIATVNGIISLMMILIFIILLFIFIINHIDHMRKREKFDMTVLTSMILGIAAVNLFESTLIYILSFISMIFWIYSGYLVSIIGNRNIE